MHAFEHRLCVLGTNKLNFLLGFIYMCSLCPMVSGKVMMSSGPSCLVILQRQTALLCFVTYTVWRQQLQIGTVRGRSSKEEGVSEPDSREREKWWDMFLDEDVSLRRQGVTTSRLVVTTVFNEREVS